MGEELFASSDSITAETSPIFPVNGQLNDSHTENRSHLVTIYVFPCFFLNPRRHHIDFAAGWSPGHLVTKDVVALLSSFWQLCVWHRLETQSHAFDLLPGTRVAPGWHTDADYGTKHMCRLWSFIIYDLSCIIMYYHAISEILIIYYHVLFFLYHGSYGTAAV